MRLALYQPDIPQNAGAMLRLASCFDVGVDIVEPCGFVFDDRKLRRAGMDYAEAARPIRHRSWEAYLESPRDGRLVLLTTGGDLPYQRFDFRPSDTLLLGRESAGVPVDVHQTVDARVVIPMAPDARSLNVVTAAAIVLAEALRQTGSLDMLQTQGERTT